MQWYNPYEGWINDKSFHSLERALKNARSNEAWMPYDYRVIDTEE